MSGAPASIVWRGCEAVKRWEDLLEGKIAGRAEEDEGIRPCHEAQQPGNDRWITLGTKGSYCGEALEVPSEAFGDRSDRLPRRAHNQRRASRD